MRKFNLATVLYAGITLLLAAGCQDKEDLYIKVPNDRFFDFKLNQSLSLNIDYGFKGKEYIVLFDLYDQNPLTLDENGQTIKKEGLNSLYRAATDGDGKFSGKIELLSSLTEVWLYSEYLGTLSPVKLEVKDSILSFNQEEYIKALESANTRAATSSNNIYPDGWLTLGDWDQLGKPDYLLPARRLPPARILNNINEVYVKFYKTELSERHPGLIGKNSSEVKIIKPTKVNLVFINSTANWDNTVGYFTYPTGQEPTNVSQIKRIIAFPNASIVTKLAGGAPAGGLSTGDGVQLKYWDGEKFHEEFPAGVSIGWWMAGMGFKAGGITHRDQYDRISLAELNATPFQRCVSLRDSKSDQIVAVGFEDNLDKRYNDATFYLEVEEGGAIDSDIPVLPEVGQEPTDEENFTTYRGTLSFEDLWPSMGDYDMNDVMISYSCSVYKQIIGNAVYKVVDEFTPLYDGAELINGFGYQLSDLSNGAVHSVHIEGDVKSRYMEGNSLEPGQSHPTILLFDNVKEVVGKTFKVTMELNSVSEASVKPPYNPFIFIGSDISRNKEVHMVKFPPTDKMDMSFFGTGDDRSHPEDGLFYVTRYTIPFPFVLHLPSVLNFPFPEEGKRIDKAYPKFTTWVQSGGTKDKDWYKYPKK